MNGAWFAFLLPVMVLPVMMAVWRIGHPNSYNDPGSARARCLSLIVAGAATGLFFFVRLPALMDASTLFLTDPSCAFGTAPTRPAGTGAACRSEAVVIAQASQVHRRSSTYYFLTLATANGSRPRVELRYSPAWMRIWNTAAASPGTVARAQVFKNEVVAVSTEAGFAPTTADPQARVLDAQEWALIGAGVFVAGIIELLFSWQSLF